MKNYGLKIEPRATDYVAGDGNIKLGALPPVPSGDWTPYFDFFERQMLTTGDTNGCVCFTAQEVFDAQIEQKMQAGTIPAGTLTLFNDLGYMDLGTDGKMHFHSSPRWLQILTGNGLNGNNVYDAWDVIRKYGVLPYKDLPIDPLMTPQEYVNPKAITQAMRDKAQQLLLAIGGKQSVLYHWILLDKHNFQATIPALQYSPLCDGVNVGDNWNNEYPPAPASGEAPGHCVARIKDILPLTAVEYDHYLPNPKYLVNYPIVYSLQAIVTITPPPPAPVLPPNPTIEQTSSWITQLVGWVRNLIESITPEGRARLGGAARSPKWEAVEQAFIKLNPTCKVCETKNDLNVHHIVAFHIDPSKELDPTNLITLCRPHHLLFGHFMNWKNINKDVRADAANWDTKIKGR